MSKIDSSKNTSVNKMLDIVECIYNHGGSAKIIIISKELGLNKSTVHRLLNALKERSYIFQDERDSSYSLGSRFYTLGEMFHRKLSFVEILKPYINDLSNRYNETVQIAILESNSEDIPKVQPIYRTSVEGALFNVVPDLGVPSTAHTSASGKCLLAFSDETFNHLFKNQTLPKYTEKSIIDGNKLIDVLKNVKTDGWACDIDELEEGISCYAVPIIDMNGYAIAAISMVGATIRMGKLDIPILINELKSIAKKLII